MKNLISHILSFLLNLIPRNMNLLVFSSFPDFTDNSYAVYKHVKGEYEGKYKCVWIFSDKDNRDKYKDVHGCYKYTAKAFWYLARARYVFCTHGLYSFISFKKNDKIVNLWHGMPLKTIGALDPQNDAHNPTQADYLIATSPFFQDLMSRAFNSLDKDKVFVVGQPRNDLLFEQTDFFYNRNIDRSEFKSVGVWLPTYRNSIVGDIRVDGVPNDNGVSFLSMDDLLELDSFLHGISSLLIIKLHPMDALQNVDFSDFSNILVIKQKDMTEQLYPLLGACDYLLTDYSSVWIDYCILGRPIGFVMNDIEEYKNSRGLTIEDLDVKLPGTIISSLDKLKEFIRCRPYEKSEYLELYNTYTDGFSCSRLCEKLGL